MPQGNTTKQRGCHTDTTPLTVTTLSLINLTITYSPQPTPLRHSLSLGIGFTAFVGRFYTVCQWGIAPLPSCQTHPGRPATTLLASHATVIFGRTHTLFSAPLAPISTTRRTPPFPGSGPISLTASHGRTPLPVG